MHKSLGWVRPNGNMNFSIYMDLYSQIGLDKKTLEFITVRD
jgi:hypothetical protein